MSHPKDEEWMAYLYGELEAAQRAELDAHLRVCPQCQEQVGTWQRVAAELDAWRLAEPGRPAGRRMSGMLRAVAAAVLVALGLVVGRLTAVSPQRMRAELEPVLRASLEPALREQIRQELRAEWQQALAQACDELRSDLAAQTDADIEEALATAASTTSRLLTQFAESLDAVRRSDLFTLAALTERELAWARQQVASTLAYPAGAVPVQDGSSGGTVE